MLELEESSVSGKTGAMQAELNRSIMTGTSINSELFSGFYGPINRGGLRQPLGAKARPKWGDYIEGLLRPKLKVSEDDLDRVHLDLDRQRSKANRSTGRRGMWLIAFIGNELLTNL